MISIVIILLVTCHIGYDGKNGAGRTVSMNEYLKSSKVAIPSIYYQLLKVGGYHLSMPGHAMPDHAYAMHPPALKIVKNPKQNETKTKA